MPPTADWGQYVAFDDGETIVIGTDDERWYLPPQAPTWRQMLLNWLWAWKEHLPAFAELV